MEEIKKQYFSIGEVSKKLEVPASVIRFWETEFTQIHPKKNRKGNRVYTAKDIEVLEKIHYLLKIKKYTIKGAKELMDTDFVVEKEELSPSHQSNDIISNPDFQDIDNQDIVYFLIKTRKILLEIKNLL